jgi:AcrR family transcriptional regulator
MPQRLKGRYVIADPVRLMKPLTIAELVALTDVPTATIHYYLRHGLLPNPRRVAANRFAYDDRHVVGLKLIRTLRERRGLSLPMIRRILPELLRLEGEEAFSPEIWDRVLAPRLSARRLPSNRLLEAAKDAFTHRGYADVNVDDICRAAHIAKGSFYRHFDSKEDLFLAAAESLAAEVAVRFAGEVRGEAGEDPPAVLARLLAPGLPVFLELFARALQGRAEYESAAKRIVQRATVTIGSAVNGKGHADERGARILRDAVLTLFRRLLDSRTVDGDSPSLATPGPVGV